MLHILRHIFFTPSCQYANVLFLIPHGYNTRQAYDLFHLTFLWDSTPNTKGLYCPNSQCMCTNICDHELTSIPISKSPRKASQGLKELPTMLKQHFCCNVCISNFTLVPPKAIRHTSWSASFSMLFSSINSPLLIYKNHA